MPHLEGFPFSELSEEVQGLDSIKTISLFKPVMKQDELSRVIFKIKTYSFFADSVILSEPFLLFFFKCSVVNDLQIIWISLVIFRFLEIDKLIDVGDIFENQLNIPI